VTKLGSVLQDNDPEGPATPSPSSTVKGVDPVECQLYTSLVSIMDREEFYRIGKRIRFTFSPLGEPPRFH
jgi:hypothetical protein